MAFLEIKNISKSYEMKDSSLLVIDNFDELIQVGYDTIMKNKDKILSLL